MIDKLSEIERENLQKARILYYDFFYGLLVFEMLDSRGEVALKQLNLMLEAPLNVESQIAMESLKSELENNGIANLKAEFSSLFSLPFGKKQVGMHLSHYYENCIGGESLLTMRQLVKKSAVRVNTSEFREGEEHLGFICGFMRYLLESGEEALAKEVFNFSKDAFYGLIAEIKEREDSKCYRALAEIMESFLKVEEDICS